jgi:glucokinase
LTGSTGGLTVGLDLGGTKALGVVVDPTGTGGPLVEEKVATPRGAAAVVDALADLGGRLRDRAAGELGRPVTAIGVGAPGLVDRGGTLRFAPNLPGVVDVGFATVLGERLGLPVAVDNDATCAAWGEHERGASRGHDHSLLVTLGTGIGAGITVKGQALRGANGFAGEPGHMVVDPDGLPCPCGRRGCWERYASGSGLGHLAREAVRAGGAGAAVSLAGGRPEDVRGEHVTAAAAAGDAEALDVLARFGWWVALGIANLVNVLDSDIVVVGGGLVAAGDLILDPTRAAYRELVLGAEHRPVVPIVPALLGGHAGAIGAALLAAARS